MAMVIPSSNVSYARKHQKGTNLGEEKDHRVLIIIGNHAAFTSIQPMASNTATVNREDSLSDLEQKSPLGRTYLEQDDEGEDNKPTNLSTNP